MPKGATSITCEILSKQLCDMYNDDSDTEVTNGPCFFNGPDDSKEMLCVTKSTFSLKSCVDIKTNSKVLFNKNIRESCNEAHVLLGWSFTCAWGTRYIDDVKFCATIYYLTGNGLFIFFKKKMMMFRGYTYIKRNMSVSFRM
jgi:hypothetical protein